MDSVLVTGASTGIGRATALRLAAAGWRVFAGVRREEDAAALREAAVGPLQPLFLDVTDPGQIEAARERVEADGAALAGLVNNAGVAIPGPLETLPLEDFRRQVEINLTGQVAVTQALLPAVRAGGGRLVFVSSIGGRMALPLTGAYHAAKYGIEAVGDVFRQELRPWRIPVSIVEPGSIDTPIWERGERAADEVGSRSPRQEELYGRTIERYRAAVRRTAERGIPPEKVARTIERALTARRPRSRYLVGIDAKVQARLKTVLPTPWMDRLVARAIGL
ncbi:MAG: SDR family NAD(P)-dependent oxidoreductase [Solirubrobacterales bacterium]